MVGGGSHSSTFTGGREQVVGVVLCGGESRRMGADKGRVVLEVVTDAPRTLSGGPFLFLLSSKMKDDVALWRLRRQGEAGASEAGRVQQFLHTAHSAEGDAEMISRWDLIFVLLDHDKDYE